MWVECAETTKPQPDPLTAILEEACQSGVILGAQACVIVRGRIIVQLAVGEAAPGVPITWDDFVPWFSASKLASSCAVALGWDAGWCRWPNLGPRMAV